MVSAAVVHRALFFCLIVGLGFSLFATAESLDPALQNVCSVNALFSCHNVDKSQYSHVGPVPDWSIGVGGFLVMIVVEVLLVRTYDPRYLHLLLGLSTLALAISAVLAYTEVFLIMSICPICLGAYLSNLGVLACALTLVRIRRVPPRGSDEREGSPPREEPRAGNDDPDASSEDAEPGSKAD